jgi:hypothetical protein
LPVSQSFTFIDVAGNRAQYSVSDTDQQSDFRWSTEYGDHGFAPSFEDAQYRARTVLKGSMAADRRSDEATKDGKSPRRWRLQLH